MGEEMSDVLERAMQLGREKYPNDAPPLHAGFANSVSYAVTGFAGGYGGPRMREHWCSRILHTAGVPGQISFEQAVSLCETACYGPMTVDIASMLSEEHCFDDLPADLEVAQQLLSGET